MEKKRNVESLNWIAETKFHAPLLREDVITRRLLLEDLHRNILAFPLTLISAPAGYGKTTLLATLTKVYPDLQVAWLSLDEEDNDPVRFLTAIIVALQQLNPACGAAAQSLLIGHTFQPVEVRRVTSVLINDVLNTLSDSFTLILDDLHRISEPSIFVALDYLLEHRPPQLSMVVSTRVDPPLALARLRARGELAELRLKSLRFSDEEVGTFFNNHLQIGLSNADVSFLSAETEGWAVGLRLLASSLTQVESSEESRRLLQNLAQSKRNIFAFLAEEVFTRQEPEIKQFLLETAILPEMTPPLCRAVTDRSDASTLLEKLYYRNLFLIQVSPGQSQVDAAPNLPPLEPSPGEKWETRSGIRYRYHELFREFLRQKLNQEWPEHERELHFLAAQAEKNPARAVVHYLLAEAWSEAADLIELIGVDMFNQGYLETLSRWIRALPATERESRPLLLHYLSHSAMWNGAWDEVLSLLDGALQGFKAAGNDAGQGEVLTDMATCTSGLGDIERSAMLFGRALTHNIPPHTRVQALLGHALARGALGDWQQTQKDFFEAMDIVQQNSELDPVHLVTFPFFHPGFAFLPGALEHLERVCRQARAQVGNAISPSRLMIEEMTTVLHLFHGQLDDAIRVGEEALVLRERLGGHPYSSLDAALFLMIAHAARGDFVSVESLFDRLFLGVEQTDHPPPDLPVYLFYAGRIRWLSGRIREAREICDRLGALIEKSSLRDSLEIRICHIWLRSLLDLTDGRYGEAERALLQPEVFEQKDRGSTMHGNTRLMLARLYWHQKKPHKALAMLSPVLTYYKQLDIAFTIILEGQSIVPLLRFAVEEGIHEAYANYLLGILSAKEERTPTTVPATGEALTPREVDVLHLIVSGYGNRAIAEELVISEWTVKSHITKIYRKLDVASRAQAIVRAHDLGFD